MARSYSITQLQDAVSKSETWAETFRNLNLVLSGGSLRTVKKLVEENKINTSHFLGWSWSTGKKRPELSKAKKLSDYLIEGSTYSTRNLKERLFKEGIKERKCEWCALDKWRDIPISLELDHINGVNNDNRLENLRILCPNCHAQTPTYRGKNTKKVLSFNKIKKNYLCVCGSKVSRNNVNCRSCSLKRVFKNKTGNIIKPSKQDLLIDLKTMSKRAAARKYGVSDVTIANWLKNYEALV